MIWNTFSMFSHLPLRLGPNVLGVVSIYLCLSLSLSIYCTHRRLETTVT